MEAGKRRLAGDTTRAATTDEVKDLRREAGALKEVVADLTLERVRWWIRLRLAVVPARVDGIIMRTNCKRPADPM